MSTKAIRPGSVRYVASEIERMCDDLNLDTSVAEQALRLFSQALEQEYEADKLDDVSTACVYGTVRVHPTAEVSFRDVTRVARIPDNRIYTVSNRLFNEIGLETPPPDPKNSLKSGCRTLDLDHRIDDLEAILEYADAELERDVAPTTLAASVIFAGQYLDGFDYALTQEAVSDAVGPTMVSIRKCYTAILRELLQFEEVSINTHAFHSVEHGLGVVQAEFDVSEKMLEDTRQYLDDAVDEFGDLASTEGLVGAALFLTTSRSDEQTIRPEDFVEVVDVTESTISKYTTKLERDNE